MREIFGVGTFSPPSIVYFITDLYSTFYDVIDCAWGRHSFELYYTHHKADYEATEDVRAGVTAWYADFTPRSVRCIVKTHLKTAPEHAPPCVGEKCPIPCVPPHPPQC